jgi:peptidoglycan lytic transglycosylase D
MEDPSPAAFQGKAKRPMQRSSLWAFVCVLTACGGGARPGRQPTPSPATGRESPDSTPTVASLSPSLPVLPDPAGPLPRPDSLEPGQVDADSAADARILEQLATAHPEPQDTGNEDGAAEAVPGGANAAATAEVTYDIDVSTYGSHARVQYYLDFFQGPARERFSIWLQRMPRYEAMIRAKLRENGVPEDMVYLALIESGFSNSAYSRARATGMWQFIKGTGKLYGLRVDSWVDERRDPIRSTDAAARHLADLRDRFGSMYLAAAAYNAGAGKVNRGLRRLGDDEEEEEDNPDATFFRLYDTRFLRRETKDYVPKLIAAALIAKQPERYGFERPSGIPAMTYDSIIVPDATGLDVLARLADTSIAALRELNPHFIRLVTPPRQQAVVRVPSGTGDLVTARYAALEPKDRVSFVEHTIARGETLAGIARSYRVSTRLIADANPGIRMNRLRPGVRLVIPTSFVPTLPEPAATTGHGRPKVPAGTTTTIRYRVRSGESLWTIAQQSGTSVGELRSLNSLSSTERLRAGQVIRVPAAVEQPAPPARAEASAGGRTHLVKRGETLSEIANRYRVPLASLRDANGLSSTAVIKAGSRLTIPD